MRVCQVLEFFGSAGYAHMQGIVVTFLPQKQSEKARKAFLERLTRKYTQP